MELTYGGGHWDGAKHTISTTGMGMGRIFGAVLASVSIDLVRMAGGKQTTDHQT